MVIQRNKKDLYNWLIYTLLLQQIHQRWHLSIEIKQQTNAGFHHSLNLFTKLYNYQNSSKSPISERPRHVWVTCVICCNFTFRSLLCIHSQDDGVPYLLYVFYQPKSLSILHWEMSVNTDKDWTIEVYVHFLERHPHTTRWQRWTVTALETRTWRYQLVL